MRVSGRSMTLKMRVLLASALGVALLAAVTGQADVIRLVPGSTVKAAGGQLNGQIVTETPAELKLKPATGAELAVPVDQIESVTYDGAPPSFLLAEARVNAGALVEAADLFQKAVGEAQGKTLLERAAQFGRAEMLTQVALVDPSKVGDATAALEAFVKAHGNSRQLGPALLSLVRLRLAEGDTAKAEEALGELTARVPWAADRAAVLKARVLARKGENEAAITELDALIAGAAKDSVRARESKLAKAESLAALKRFDEAEAVVREVIAEAPAEDDPIQSVAYNTLGDCMRAAGRPKDALLAYLRTDILFSDAKDQHARALARIAELWTELNQATRAAEVRDRLQQQYPQSPYAKGSPGSCQ